MSQETEPWGENDGVDDMTDNPAQRQQPPPKGDGLFVRTSNASVD